MDPMTMIGLGSTLFGLGGQMFTDSPEFNPLTGDYGVHGDYSYNPEREFGQSTAQQNMGRYGFQGVYQNYLKDEAENMKRNEMQRIQKLASGLAPGQASLRGGVASQGVGGSTSNVIARQQREQGIGKALDFAGQQAEESNARLDQQYFGATQANEAMRFGASQDYMKALGMSTQAGNQASEFNQRMAFGRDSFNQQQLLARDQFNAQGEFQQEKGEYDKWNNIFGEIGGMGAGMFAQGIAGGGLSNLFGGLDSIGQNPSFGGLNPSSVQINPLREIPNRASNYYYRRP